MANVKLDFSKMKHVHSDDKYTTLQHKDGHSIRLAHSALSPENQKALSALSAIAKQAATPAESDQAAHKGAMMADGGDVESILNNWGSKANTAMGVEGQNAIQPTPQNQVPVDTSRDVRTPEQKAAAQHFEQTGELPEWQPKQPQMAQGGEATQEETPEQGGTAGNPTSRIDSGWGKVIIREADGGVVPGHPGSETCQACGGVIRKKYASSDDLVSKSDDAPTNLDPNSANPAPEDSMMQQAMDMTPKPSQVNPEREHFQHLYNDSVDRQHVASLGKAPTPDMYQKMQNQKFDFQSGKTPSDINLPAEQQAEVQLDKEHAQQQVMQDQSKQQQDAFAQAKQNLGLGEPQQPQDQTQNDPNAPAPGAVQPPAGNPPAKPGMPSYEDMLSGAYNSGMAGINQQATALGQLGQDRSQVLQDAERVKTDAMNRYQTNYDALNKERLDHIADIQNGYIDPNKYWIGDANGNGSHSKIAAGLGMILAGFNPSSKPNAAIDFLKYQMDQNINAQVQNLGAKKTLLEANLRQFGNMRDATDMTRLMQSDIVANQLDQAAAKAATPLAKAAALNAKSQLQQQMAPLAMGLTMRKALMSYTDGNNGDPSNTAGFEHMLNYMRAVDPKQAAEYQQLLVPGVGISKIPVPEAVRSELVAHQKLDSIGKDVLNYSKTHTNLVPGSAEYNIGVQKAQILQQAIREGLLGTVFRESEKPLLEKFVDDNPAGALKTLSSQPKIKTILESNQMQLNTLKSNYGLPTQKPAEQSEPEVKTYNGAQYRKVNGGWQKVK